MDEFHQATIAAARSFVSMQDSFLAAAPDRLRAASSGLFSQGPLA